MACDTRSAGTSLSHKFPSSFRRLCFTRESPGVPARTVGWCDLEFIHTSFLKDLWPNKRYTYRVRHRLFDGTIVWSQEYQFKAPPFPRQDSLQCVVIFGDLGKPLGSHLTFIGVASAGSMFGRTSLSPTNWLPKNDGGNMLMDVRMPYCSCALLLHQYVY
ncbi:hypothetical protein K1719_040794 [Acacia pycnantha]|nr:hypothetical protein K1719_040794 [Acacia pycnantha]